MAKLKAKLDPRFTVDELLEIVNDFSVREVPIEVDASLGVMRDETLAHLDQAQIKIGNTVDGLDLDEYTKRLQGSLLDAATLPSLQPLIDRVGEVKSEHLTFRRKAITSFFSAFVTGFVLRLFFLALGLAISFACAWKLDPFVQDLAPFEFSVVILFLISNYPIEMLVTWLKRLLYNLVCGPRLAQLRETIDRTDQLCDELTETYSEIMKKL